MTPVFETIALKFFSAERLFDDKSRLVDVLDTTLQLPVFGGIERFDTCAYFPLTGPQRRIKINANGLDRVRTLLLQSEARSINLLVEQEAYHVRLHEIAFSFAKRRRQEMDGFNKLALYFPIEAISVGDCDVLINFFKTMVIKLDSCYAFCCLHVDSPDSSSTKQEILRRIHTEPLDSLSWNRYIWSCDQEIRDVSWLNYLSHGHLEKLPKEVDSELAELCPMVEHVPDGLIFSAGRTPVLAEEEQGRISLIRAKLSPVICDDDWYELD